MLGVLYPIASLLGIEAGELVERVRKNAVLWCAIAVFGFIALVFLLMALHAALSLWAGPIYGPLILAGGAALTALCIYAASRFTADVAHRREVQRRQSAETTALVTTATVTALPIIMRSPLMRRIGLPVGGALAALYLLSKSRPKGEGSEQDQ